LKMYVTQYFIRNLLISFVPCLNVTFDIDLPLQNVASCQPCHTKALLLFLTMMADND